MGHLILKTPLIYRFIWKFIKNEFLTKVKTSITHNSINRKKYCWISVGCRCSNVLSNYPRWAAIYLLKFLRQKFICFIYFCHAILFACYHMSQFYCCHGDHLDMFIYRRYLTGVGANANLLSLLLCKIANFVFSNMTVDLVFGVELTLITVSKPATKLVVTFENYIRFVDCLITLIARLMGPTWGPSGAGRTQVGPMLAPWTLLSGMGLRLHSKATTKVYNNQERRKHCKV